MKRLLGCFAQCLSSEAFRRAGRSAGRLAAVGAAAVAVAVPLVFFFATLFAFFFATLCLRLASGTTISFVTREKLPLTSSANRLT